MAKALLGSILIVPLLIALRAATRRDAKKGVQQAILLSLGFEALWVLSVIYLYFRLL